MTIDISKAELYLRGAASPDLASAVKDKLESEMTRYGRELRPRDVIYAAYRLARATRGRAESGHTSAFSPAEAFRAMLSVVEPCARGGEDKEDMERVSEIIAQSYAPSQISGWNHLWLSYRDVDLQKAEDLFKEVGESHQSGFAWMQQAKCILHRVQHTELSDMEVTNAISEAWHSLDVAAYSHNEPRAAKLMGNLLLNGVTPHPGFIDTPTLYPTPVMDIGDIRVSRGDGRMIHEYPEAVRLYEKGEAWLHLRDLFSSSADHLVNTGDLAGVRDVSSKALHYADKALGKYERQGAPPPGLLRKMARNAYTAMAIDAPPAVDVYDINWGKEYATAAAIVTHCYEHGIGVSQNADVAKNLSRNTCYTLAPRPPTREWDAWFQEAKQSIARAVAKQKEVQDIKPPSPAKPSSSPKNISAPVQGGDGVMVSPVDLHNAIAQATTNSKPTRQKLSR